MKLEFTKFDFLRVHQYCKLTIWGCRFALSARGLARANRNNRIAELAYGSYSAQIQSEPAPEDGFPRQQ